MAHTPKTAARHEDDQSLNRETLLFKAKGVVVPIARPGFAREGLGVLHAVEARGVALGPVIADIGFIDGLIARLRVAGIRDDARDSEGVGPIMGRFKPSVVAIARRKILPRRLLQKGRSQDLGIELIVLPKLHFHAEVDDIAVTHANGFPVRGPIEKDIHRVHHVFKGRLYSKPDGDRVSADLPVLMRLYRHYTDQHDRADHCQQASVHANPLVTGKINTSLQRIRPSCIRAALARSRCGKLGV
jgi:hypothetical protein